VWRRAAELQAEAAARLESRIRSTQDTRSLVMASAANTEAADSAEPVPVDAYRVRDVESAAAEAGISQRYVALAMAELQSAPSAMAMVAPVPEWKDRLTTRLFGTEQRSLSVSRVYRHPPRVVLQALGRILQAAPWSLILRDTLGGHPLDGGVLVFDLPNMVDGTYKWTYARYGTFVPDLRVMLAAVPGDAKSCEVTMQLDLRKGVNANLVGAAGFLTAGGTVGGLAGLAVGKAALALAGAALLGPAVGGAALLGLGSLVFFGPGYRYALRKCTAELNASLTAVDTAIRSVDIFGESLHHPRDDSTTDGNPFRRSG
jgi:eukaryotic-like serine/threonine-protein kinase